MYLDAYVRIHYGMDVCMLVCMRASVLLIHQPHLPLLTKQSQSTTPSPFRLSLHDHSRNHLQMPMYPHESIDIGLIVPRHSDVPTRIEKPSERASV